MRLGRGGALPSVPVPAPRGALFIVFSAVLNPTLDGLPPGIPGPSASHDSIPVEFTPADGLTLPLPASDFLCPFVPHRAALTSAPAHFAVGITSVLWPVPIPVAVLGKSRLNQARCGKACQARERNSEFYHFDVPLFAANRRSITKRALPPKRSNQPPALNNR
jgi:hypothetical protein